MKIRRKSKEQALEELTIESGENAIANKEVEGLTQWQIIRRRFFKHKAPGSKSTFFKIKLSGLSITDKNTRAMIEASVKAAVERTKPAYSELISVEWV